jgi:3-phenylpropionate/trans-cinnamate dioxygenase ferredoxin subunit
MSRYVTATQVDSVEPGNVKAVEADGLSLCIGRTTDGRWGAIANVCTHDGGILGDGELDGNAVECPRHGGRFDLFSGRVLALPALGNVQAYAVRVVGKEVQVEL